MLLGALYRFRLHQISQEFNVRVEERVNERTRIARELHDTLLQGLHGLMFRFQVADTCSPGVRVRPRKHSRVLWMAPLKRSPRHGTLSTIYARPR
jgi:hypothetical protein